MKRTKAQAMATREGILDAAEWCYRTLGASASLAAVAARARCSRGAIYWHFPCPADLLQAVLERGRLPLVDRLEALARTESPGLVTLQTCLRDCLRLIQDDEHVRSVLEILVLRCDFAGERARLRVWQQEEMACMLRLLESILGRCERSGVLRSGVTPSAGAALLGFALLGGIRYSLTQHPASESDSGASARAALDLAFAAVANPLLEPPVGGGEPISPPPTTVRRR